MDMFNEKQRKGVNYYYLNLLNTFFDQSVTIKKMFVIELRIKEDLFELTIQHFYLFSMELLEIGN